ncbi:threonine/homoserine/homoserine lactone efflux protein [Deinococcus metalli]|uniref:RhtB family transporter n=1 Tax=Deinococcus metalli TaxID=1141878 RepID=A0A7W8NP54_9DEIO|nr:LysE family translocator [Deinococcus metalli]MBB5377629.1 threonine/homoserine/homoserine lactone efflux protein [Deinococcus metalli]GHF52165.1 RhtB family transporter [Deinococcus metalli]
MPDLPTLLTFAVAALALLLIPGPSVLYIVARSMQQGRRAGLVSALGVQTGGLVHVVAATVGVSALVLSSALLFSVLKFVGAAYLIYLGVRTLLSREEVADVALPPTQPLARIFWQGATVNALNPKTAIFFLAFLPQFVHPGHGPVWGQTLLLGLEFLALATVSDSTYALLAGSVGRKLRGNQVFARRQKYVTGSVYVALGVGTATVGHS